MVVTIREPAGGEYDRFGPHAFDARIGDEVPMKFEGERCGTAKLVAAEIIEDGRAALLTLDVTGDRAEDMVHYLAHDEQPSRDWKWLTGDSQRFSFSLPPTLPARPAGWRGFTLDEE